MFTPILHRKKLAGRMGAIAGNGFFLMLPGLANQLISLFVVRHYQAGTWGAVVEVQLAFYLLSSLLAWGNKEYLIRRYSDNPALINELFTTSLSTRFALMPLVLFPLLFFHFETYQILCLVIWLFCRFFSQSAESLMVYNKSFHKGVIAEITALVMMFGILWSDTGLSPTQHVFFALTVSQVIRCLVLIAYYRTYLVKVPRFFDRYMLKQSFWFCMLAFTGFLHSRTDLLCVISFLNKEDIAYYQVLTGFLLLVQSGSNFILQPFSKNIYRMNEQGLGTLSLQLLLSGLAICAAALAAIYGIMTYWYNFETDISILTGSFVYMVVPYFYLPAVYRLYKNHQTHLVILINTAGIIALAGLYLLFMQIFPPTIQTSLWTAAAVQVLIAILFKTAGHGKTQH